ncbi:MAG: twitching motility protein PilT, partial [Bacteroidota bacterium]|nr:twitching motility protein PilT [Bacteroidota bacterium]
LRVVPVEASHFMQSAASTFGDLEDGAQYFAASASGALDGVVTRDKDFKGNVAVPVYTAKQALALIRRS